MSNTVTHHLDDLDSIHIYERAGNQLGPNDIVVIYRVASDDERVKALRRAARPLRLRGRNENRNRWEDPLLVLTAKGE